MKRYLNILRNIETPGRFLAARLLVKTGLCAALKIRQAGYTLRFYPSNLSEQLWINPAAREPALEFFRQYVRPGDRIIDVGSNVGDTALACANRAGPTGAIWAIEPSPRTFRYLAGNIKLNSCRNIRCLNVAVGAKPGRTLFGNDRRDDMNQVGDPGFYVPMARLDDLIPEEKTFALLKIDVEGYELPALKGAIRLLQQTRCIYFEVSNTLTGKFGYEITDLLVFLDQQGFILFRQSSPNSLERIPLSFSVTHVENLIGARDPLELVARTSWQLS